jgi:hypothetical protein
MRTEKRTTFLALGAAGPTAAAETAVAMMETPTPKLRGERATTDYATLKSSEYSVPCRLRGPVNRSSGSPPSFDLAEMQRPMALRTGRLKSWARGKSRPYCNSTTTERPWRQSPFAKSRVTCQGSAWRWAGNEASPQNAEASQGARLSVIGLRAAKDGASSRPSSSAEKGSVSKQLNVNFRPGVLDWLGQLLAPTRRGRIRQFSVLGIIAALCFFIGLFVAGQNQREAVARRIRLVPAQAGSRGVEALLLPVSNATDVSVAGSFSSWDPIPLSDDDGNGLWGVSVVLPPGRHEYAFIINGRWWGHDPLADGYVRSFGDYSSVRYIGGGDGT